MLLNIIHEYLSLVEQTTSANKYISTISAKIGRNLAISFSETCQFHFQMKLAHIRQSRRGHSKALENEEPSCSFFSAEVDLCSKESLM